MRALLIAMVTAFVLVAQITASPEPSQHASRDAVLTFLRSEGILGEGTTLVEANWDKKGHWWFVRIRHPSGGITNWTVDADAKDYHFVCKH